MPRYKFHVFNDDHTLDGEGRDFPDIAEARAYAIDCAREIMAEDLKIKGEINLGHWIEIEDEQGEIEVVPFAEAIKIR
jgi:hypothetical protein